jgi:hypothetical protein
MKVGVCFIQKDKFAQPVLQGKIVGRHAIRKQDRPHLVLEEQDSGYFFEVEFDDGRRADFECSHFRRVFKEIVND